MRQYAGKITKKHYTIHHFSPLFSTFFINIYQQYVLY